MSGQSALDNRDDEPYRSPLAPCSEPVEPPRPTPKWDWTLVALIYVLPVIYFGGYEANELAQRAGVRTPEFVIFMFLDSAFFLGGTFAWYILVLGAWRARLAALPGILLYVALLWRMLAPLFD
jgi:hypothetical protein